MQLPSPRFPQQSSSGFPFSRQALFSHPSSIVSPMAIFLSIRKYIPKQQPRQHAQPQSAANVCRHIVRNLDGSLLAGCGLIYVAFASPSANFGFGATFGFFLVGTGPVSSNSRGSASVSSTSWGSRSPYLTGYAPVPSLSNVSAGFSPLAIFAANSGSIYCPSLRLCFFSLFT